MAHSYEASKKVALKTIIILGIVTIVEVTIALVGKGHIFENITFPWYIMNLVMIILSLYKAYLIVGEFMHIKHEVKSLALSVILPTLLLVWAVIAFLQEGGAWKNNRDYVKEKNEIDAANPQGMLLDKGTKKLNED